MVFINQNIDSLVRGILLSGGTLLASHGVAIPDATWQVIVGGVMAVISVIWSQFFHAKNPA